MHTSHYPISYEKVRRFANLFALLWLIGWPTIGLLALLTTTHYKHRSPAFDTAYRLRQLAFGSLMYAQDYDDRLPAPGQNWDDVLYPYVKSRDVFTAVI